MDINEAVQFAVEINKKLLGIGSTALKGYAPHPLYPLAIDMSEHISYHAVKGVFPEKIFSSRSPNQTDAELKYIKDNYKQFTLPVFIDLMSTVGRMFADNNWHVDYGDNSEFKDYVENDIPNYASLENYMKFVLLTNKMIDANGFVSVRPKDIPVIQKDGSDEYIVDPSIKYSPCPVYFPAKNVMSYQDGKYYMFLSNEKSTVLAYDKPQQVGSIFELYLPEGMYFIVQVGKKNDNKFEVRPYFNYKNIPVIQMKGLPMLIEDKVLWQSQFIYAVDLLDTVLANENWLQASVNKCVYPHIVMVGSPCEFRDVESGAMCNGGILNIEGAESTCKQCNGSGLKSRLSPLGTLLINPNTKFEAGEVGMSQAPLQFVAPSVDTLKFIQDKIQKDEDKARKILHIRSNSSDARGNPLISATEIASDSRAMFAFIKPISDQTFNIYDFLLKRIGEQRDGETFVPPSVHDPKTFDFKTPEDYLNEIAEAIKNNLPPSFVQYVLMKYIDSIYGDNEQTVAIFNVIVEADRIFGLSEADIAMKLAKGTIANWEDILHTSAVNFITQSIESDPKFLDKKMPDKVSILQDLAKAKDEEIKSTAQTQIYNTTV